jgi:hypothetical protein
VLKGYKWKMLTPWFKAHDIGQSDSFFVQSALYAQNADLFVSATSHGEVKLWQNNARCLPIGTLNSKDWSFDVNSFVSHRAPKIDIPAAMLQTEVSSDDNN